MGKTEWGWQETFLIGAKAAFLAGGIVFVFSALLSFVVLTGAGFGAALTAVLGVSCIGIAFLTVLWISLGFIRKIEIGSVGQLLILGERSGVMLPKADGSGTLEFHGIVLKEWWHWVLPGVISFEKVDVREKTQKLDALEVFSADHVLVRFDGSIIWRVINPYLFLSITESVVTTGLDDLYDEVIRREAGAEVLDEILKAEFVADLHSVIRDNANDRAALWGIKIVRIPVPSVVPADPELTKTLGKQRQEKAEREGEHIELAFVEERIRALITPPPHGPGLERQQAIELIQSERKKVTKEIKVSEQKHTYTVEGATLNTLGQLGAGFVGAAEGTVRALGGVGTEIARAIRENRRGNRGGHRRGGGP
jgi:regulator of protease activity HflC (stomatin/prohibitin superfamily)